MILKQLMTAEYIFWLILITLTLSSIGSSSGASDLSYLDFDRFLLLQYSQQQSSEKHKPLIYNFQSYNLVLVSLTT